MSDSEVLVPQSLPGIAGEMDPLDEAQIKSAQARRVFEAQEDAAPWMEDYWSLIGEGWSWRQAVFMLWAAQPKDQRNPATQGALATEVLGLSSDRVIREWRDNPAFDARVAKLVARSLAHARAGIYAALIEAAQNPSPRAHADRRLALEMLGDYQPKQRLAVGPDLPDDLSELDAGELRMLASLPGAEDGAGGSGSGTAGAGA